MQKLAASACALAAAAFAASAALAEPETGSRVKERPAPQKLASPQAISVLHKFARCVASRDRATAIAFVLADEPTTYRKARYELFGRPNSCLKNAKLMRARADIIAGAVAEALYVTDRVEMPAELPRRSFLIERLAAGEQADLSDSVEALHSVTTCAVDREARTADAVLRTTPGSPEERRALESLSPTLSDCLAKGQTIEGSAVDLRAGLALALFHRWPSRPQPTPRI